MRSINSPLSVLLQPEESFPDPWVDIARAISTGRRDEVTPARLKRAFHRRGPEDRSILYGVIEDADAISIVRAFNRDFDATAVFLRELLQMFPHNRRHVARLARGLKIEVPGATDLPLRPGESPDGTLGGTSEELPSLPSGPRSRC